MKPNKRILPLIAAVVCMPINNSNARSGLQIGLLNHNRNARFPWLPLVNFAMR